MLKQKKYIKSRIRGKKCFFKITSVFIACVYKESMRPKANYNEV